ncbi:MAG: ferredoxin, partial [Candidatus Komeilibacteria bacterium CG_4_9_14_3_um_filter_37_5]
MLLTIMPVKKVPVYINKKKYLALPGESMLSVAQRNKIDIPHLCWHEDLPVFGGCRICLVEDSDGKVLTSCTLRATKDLAITTDTKDVQQLRQQNLQLLLANHQANCWRC